jgi:hypothetical protein
MLFTGKEPSRDGGDPLRRLGPRLSSIARDTSGDGAGGEQRGVVEVLTA